MDLKLVIIAIVERLLMQIVAVALSALKAKLEPSDENVALHKQCEDELHCTVEKIAEASDPQKIREALVPAPPN